MFVGWLVWFGGPVRFASLRFGSVRFVCLLVCLFSLFVCLFACLFVRSFVCACLLLLSFLVCLLAFLFVCLFVCKKNLHKNSETLPSNSKVCKKKTKGKNRFCQIVPFFYPKCSLFSNSVIWGVVQLSSSFHRAFCGSAVFFVPEIPAIVPEIGGIVPEIPEEQFGHII